MKKRLVIIFCLLILPCWSASVDDQLESALRFYRAGEQTSDLEERERAFNQALAIYGDLADTHPSGKIDYNLGNCYFQLGEYAWALLYYHRALQDRPRDQKIHQNLRVAQKKLGIPTERPRSRLTESILFPVYRMSMAERWRRFSIFSLLAIGFGAAFVYRRHRLLYLSALGATVASALLLAVIVGVHYFSSIHAVVIHSSVLYRDAGSHYALVDPRPIPAGSRLTVLEVTDDGEWIRVEMGDLMGFIPAEKIRLI